MFIVAISSKALFDLSKEHEVLERSGFQSFKELMLLEEKVPLKPGPAFGFIKKLLTLNLNRKEPLVRVMLLSSNSLEAGARVVYSAQYYGLDIYQAFFSSGRSRIRIAKASNVSLFLSTSPSEVREALKEGVPSATVHINPSSQQPSQSLESGLCVAFDGDAVLFSDESERVNQLQGLEAFHRNEINNSSIPLHAGPFKPVLTALLSIQEKYSHIPILKRPIRVALVTSRASPAFERVVNTFKSWGVNIEEALFCGGLPKGPFLEAIEADLFFDDSFSQVELSSLYVPSCHVPNGILSKG